MGRRDPVAREVRAIGRKDQQPFHMPGHRGGPGAPPALLALLGPKAIQADVSEMGGFDYLHQPTGALAEAQRAAADLFGAEETWFLVNGATVGNLAALLSTSGPSQRVVVARASHRSTYAGLLLSRAVPDYVRPRYHPVLRIESGFDEAELLERLAGAGPVAAVHVTRPDYYGLAQDLAVIVREAHARGVAVIVDEAHGAHLSFDDRLPSPALRAGADIVVQSPHKSLGSLTQSALLHVRGNIVDRHRLATQLALLQSSSPSSLLTASLDSAIQHMARRGRAVWRRVVDLAELAAARLPLVGSGIVVESTDAYDPTKLVLDVTPFGMTGFAASSALRRRAGLYPEFADLRHVVFSLSPGDSEKTVRSLARAVGSVISSNRAQATVGVDVPVLPRPQRALDTSVAIEQRSSPVPLTAAAGRIVAEMVIPYPPGIPLLVPGEIITAEMTELLITLRQRRCQLILSDPLARSVLCVDVAS
jgi:arginine/lysine/ornithine decarboxylase